MNFGEMKYGQMFVLAMDDPNMWVKIPLMEEPESDDHKMVNALLTSGDDDDAIFEFFEDDLIPESFIAINYTGDKEQEE